MTTLGTLLNGNVPDDWTQIGQDRGLASKIWRFSQDGVPCVAKLWDTARHGRLELLFYERLKDIGIGVPELISAEEQGDRALLVMREVVDVEHVDCLAIPSPAQLYALVEALARFHERWEDVELGDFPPPVAELTQEWLVSRRETFLSKYKDRVSGRVAEKLARVEQEYAEAVVELGDCPQVILHGDFHLDNILFRKESHKPVLLDWSRVRCGPYVLDLAQVVDFMGPPEMRIELINRYASVVPIVAPDIFQAAEDVNFIYTTCGMAYFQPQSDRETRLVAESLRRVEIYAGTKRFF